MADWMLVPGDPGAAPGRDAPGAAGELRSGWPAHRPPPSGAAWRLFLSPRGDAARRAAGGAVAGRAAAAPPTMAELPLFLHEAGPVPEPAAVVALFDLHRAFPMRAPVRRPGRPAEVPPVPVVATPAYVLARLVHLGAGERDVVASAPEGALLARAGDLLAGRGAACWFAVARRPVPPPAGREALAGPRRPRLEAAGDDPRALRRIALRAPELPVRAEAADRAVAADPEHALGQLLHGCSLIERARMPEARAAFERAVARDGELAAAWFELGKTMIRLDDLERALAAFRKAAEILPDFAPAWANSGACLGELERPKEALPWLAEAAKRDPLNHSHASNLGVTLRDLGRLAEAEAAFRRALTLAPDFVFGHYNLANAVYLQGRHAEAVRLFEAARELDPQKSTRQGLLLAAARLAAGDEAGAMADYAQVFAALEGQTLLDMRTVARWDLRRLAERRGSVSAPMRRAALYLRGLGA